MLQVWQVKVREKRMNESTQERSNMFNRDRNWMESFRKIGRSDIKAELENAGQRLVCSGLCGECGCNVRLRKYLFLPDTVSVSV